MPRTRSAGPVAAAPAAPRSRRPIASGPSGLLRVEPGAADGEIIVRLRIGDETIETTKKPPANGDRPTVSRALIRSYGDEGMKIPLVGLGAVFGDEADPVLYVSCYRQPRLATDAEWQAELDRHANKGYRKTAKESPLAAAVARLV